MRISILGHHPHRRLARSGGQCQAAHAFDQGLLGIRFGRVQLLKNVVPGDPLQVKASRGIGFQGDPAFDHDLAGDGPDGVGNIHVGRQQSPGSQ